MWYPDSLVGTDSNTTMINGLGIVAWMVNNRPSPDRVDAVAFAEQTPTHVADLHHGDVLIAAITSCTNTSNPSVMLAAGLMAKKVVERGLKVPQVVKTSRSNPRPPA